MSQQNDTHLNKLTDAAIGAHLLVKLSATGVDLVGAGEGADAVAINEGGALASAVYGSFRLLNTGGTRKMVAAGAIDLNDIVYAASAGRVDDAVTGAPIGVALEAASGAGSIIEVMPFPKTGALSIVGTGTALKIACGVATLDGSNPTPVTTGLSAIVAANVSHISTAAPGLDPTYLTVGVSSGTLNVYAWKPTGAGDTTLIASTNSAVTFYWIAIGS